MDQTAGMATVPDLQSEALGRAGFKNVLVVSRGEELFQWSDRRRDTVKAVYSITKSVLSALVGIALDRGLLTGVDQPLAAFFPEWAEGEPQREAVTLEHLLTMTAGFDWPDFDKPYWEMKRQPDWAAYVLNRSFAQEPGHAFAYNSGGSHLLAAVLTRVVDGDLLEFAREALFAPLGIHPPAWRENGGIREGGAGLFLSAAELARFGRLYLQEGEWEGKRLISAEWVRESICVRHKGLALYEPPIYASYGYHWWVSPSEQNGLCDYYFAFGYGGQYLFVVPKLHLTAVVRKSLKGRSDAIRSKELFHRAILEPMLGRGK
ncbi:serine hydrolase domain-containing protein [Gorillibacterium sp. sgz500922]|uniref:serine hydrolase domain-containing protein n=1 Tax=Gorillibacterium sp. sgz500922 TaxID=3446694 RepID=UPI003F66A9B1